MNNETKRLINNFIINVRGGLHNAQHNLESFREWVENQIEEDVPQVISDLYKIRSLIHTAVEMWNERQYSVEGEGSFDIKEFDNVMFELSEVLSEYSDEGVSGDEPTTEQKETFKRLRETRDEMRTSGGVDLTNEVIEELADEAEEGYEPSDLTGRVRITDHSEDSGAEGSRFWYQELDEHNFKDMVRSEMQGELVGVVDEEEGGIVAYIFRGYIDTLFGIIREASSKGSTEPWKDRAVYLEEIIRTCLNELDYDENTKMTEVLDRITHVENMLQQTIEGLEVGHHLGEGEVILPWNDWDIQERSLRLHLASEHGFLPEDLGGHDDWILLGDSDFGSVESLHHEDHAEYPEGGGGHIKHHHQDELFSDSGLIQFLHTSEAKADLTTTLQEMHEVKEKTHHNAGLIKNKVRMLRKNIELMGVDVRKLSETHISISKREWESLQRKRNNLYSYISDVERRATRIQEATE